jgi:mRNA interferase RelE/StbE
VYTRRAVKDLMKLDDDTKRRIGKTLLRYRNDPLKYAHKLSDSRLGGYRFRIGDYRVIFDLIDDDIVILRVGHRKDIYKA